MSAKEKQLVLDNRPADDAAKLVALQTISLGGERIARVENFVADKFKQVAMNCVGTRFGYAIDGAGRMLSVLRRHGAGFHLELLKRIRKRQWKIRIAERIVMSASIQQVGQAIVQSATDRNEIGRPRARRSLVTSPDRCT